MSKQNKRNYRGFTIIELLVVIVVIGILVTIVTVAYNGVQQQARVASLLSDMRNAADMIELKSAQSTYPLTLAAATLDASPGTTYQYTYNSSANSYCLTGTNSGVSYHVSSAKVTPQSGGCAGHGVNGVAAITNLAVNPSFEENGGWFSNNGTIFPTTPDVSTKRSGNRSQSASNVSGGMALLSLYSVGGANNLGSSVSEGGEYTSSCYFRADTPHQARLRIGYSTSNGSTYVDLPYGPYITGTSGGWTRVSYTFTVPSDTQYIRTSVFIEALSSSPAGTKAWADDAMLTKGSLVHDYADGNSSNWVWNGAVNNSTSTGSAL